MLGIVLGVGINLHSAELESCPVTGLSRTIDTHEAFVLTRAADGVVGVVTSFTPPACEGAATFTWDASDRDLVHGWFMDDVEEDIPASENWICTAISSGTLSDERKPRSKSR